MDDASSRHWRGSGKLFAPTRYGRPAQWSTASSQLFVLRVAFLRRSGWISEELLKPTEVLLHR